MTSSAVTDDQHWLQGITLNTAYQYALAALYILKMYFKNQLFKFQNLLKVKF